MFICTQQTYVHTNTEHYVLLMTKLKEN